MGVVVVLALQRAPQQPAPAVGTRGRGQVGGEQLGVGVEAQFRDGFPVHARDALPCVLGTQARAAVAADPRTENQFAACGFAHLHLHRAFGVLGRGQDGGIDIDKHRLEIPRLRQRLLGGLQRRELVRLALCRPRLAHDMSHPLRFIALQALHLRGAEAKGGAGVDCDAQRDGVGVGIDLGPGARQAGGGVGVAGQGAQGGGFGCVPCGLGEGKTRRQRPALAQSVEQGAWVAVGGGRVWGGEVDFDLADLRLRAGGDAHLDHGQGQGAVVQADVNVGREVPHGTQEGAHVVGHIGHQTAQLGAAQVGQMAKAVQRQMAIQHGLHGGRCFDLHRKLGLSCRLRCRLWGGRGGAFGDIRRLGDLRLVWCCWCLGVGKAAQRGCSAEEEDR